MTNVPKTTYRCPNPAVSRLVERPYFDATSEGVTDPCDTWGSIVDDDLRSSIEREAARVEEDALYSARGHFEASRGWTLAHYSIGVPTAVLAAIASALALSDQTTFAGIVAIAVAALSALSTFLNPSKNAQQHQAAGAAFNEVRNRARLLREIDLRASKDEDGLADSVKSLAARRDELNKASPGIPRWAFKRGRKGIQRGEASYAADSRQQGAA